MDEAKEKYLELEKGKYSVAHFWYFFYERLWSLRGMENALMDFYLFPDEVKKLFGALTSFYKTIVRRCKEELGCDALYAAYIATG